MKTAIRFVSLERPAKLDLARPTFRATYTASLELLDYELRKLDARDVLFGAGFPAHQIRADGWPYSNAKPSHPAIKLSFTSHQRPLAFDAARYQTFAANVHALALSLEALRAVDRYGVMRGRQYDGFKQLGAPAEDSRATSDALRRGSVEILAMYSGWGAHTVMDDPKGAYRRACHIHHPDAGGNAETFLAINKAYRVLSGEGA